MSVEKQRGVECWVNALIGSLEVNRSHLKDHAIKRALAKEHQELAAMNATQLVQNKI